LINEAVCFPRRTHCEENPQLFGAKIYVALASRRHLGALLAALRQEMTPTNARAGAAPGGYSNSAARLRRAAGGVLAARLGLTSPFWIGAIIAALLIPRVPCLEASIAQARESAQ
jgi:hypothetical protein